MLEEELAQCQKDIDKVCHDTEDSRGELQEIRERLKREGLTGKEKDALTELKDDLRKRKKHLWKREEQLRTKDEQMREEKLMLLREAGRERKSQDREEEKEEHKREQKEVINAIREDMQRRDEDMKKLMEENMSNVKELVEQMSMEGDIEVAISTARPADVQRIKNHLRIDLGELILLPCPAEETQESRNIEPFIWSDEEENDQHERVETFLKSNLNLPEKVECVCVSTNGSLLDTKLDGVNINGGTDFVICDKGFGGDWRPFKAYCVIELKKEWKNDYVSNPVFLQEICMISKSSYPVVAIGTDLKEFSFYYYSGENNKINILRVKTVSQALDIIEELVKKHSGFEVDIDPPVRATKLPDEIMNLWSGIDTYVENDIEGPSDENEQQSLDTQRALRLAKSITILKESY